jgi:hypothetical protein
MLSGLPIDTTRLSPPPWDQTEAFTIGYDAPVLLPADGRRTIPKIPESAEDLDHLICDGQALRGSVVPTAGGGSTFITQVTLYSAALSLTISQACYATCANHERA